MSNVRRPAAHSSFGAPAGLGAAVAVALLLAGCSAHSEGGSTGAPPPRPGIGASARTEQPAPSKATAQGSWYAFSGGRPVAVDDPTVVHRSLIPWTVQTRTAGFLSIGETLYIAVNGWGVLTLHLSPAVTGSGSPAVGGGFHAVEDRNIFGGRTINEFTTASGRILIHLYHNTVFPAAPPRSASVAYVRYDPGSGGLTPEKLPPSSEGWEAADIVVTSKGRWAIEWKKTGTEKIEFRYALYDPRNAKSTTIDRNDFVAAYAFTDVTKAPKAVRQLARAATRVEPTPAPAPATGREEVLHILLNGSPFERTIRYVLGSQRRLEAGDAALRILPAVRSGKRVYALLHSGRLLRSGLDGTAEQATWSQLPQLPPGYAYTDFWTDGRLVAAGWEEQHFTEVGAAGVYLVSIADLKWGSAG